ncbi:MAG: hypothetical protein HY423_02870 [Candidatus Lambdaproteobacteria bacterium]|nr:hypothetical protein [Candidatus Lambdaproteobacteria bacterium]
MGGGLAAEEANRLSLIVAQTRAQFPELSAVGLAYTPRPAPRQAPGAPELVLRGGGTSISPGVQVEPGSSAQVALYLRKPGYAEGYAEVAVDGRPARAWRIVAFDQRGHPDKSFEFLYALADPDGTLHYLAVVGGLYRQAEAEALGIEATLVDPGPAAQLDDWKRAFRIDFGKRFPAVPVYHGLVEEAVARFRDLDRDVPALEGLRQPIAEGDDRLRRLREAPLAEGETQAARDAATAEAAARVAGFREQLAAGVAAAETTFLGYYALRAKLDAEYAAFHETNHYRWLSAERQQGFYDHWKQVELHHPAIDELVGRFLPYLKDAAKLLAARSQAMELIRRNDNWDKDPSRPTPARPSAETAPVPAPAPVSPAAVPPAPQPPGPPPPAP